MVHTLFRPLTREWPSSLIEQLMAARDLKIVGVDSQVLLIDGPFSAVQAIMRQHYGSLLWLREAGRRPWEAITY